MINKKQKLARNYILEYRLARNMAIKVVTCQCCVCDELKQAKERMNTLLKQVKLLKVNLIAMHEKNEQLGVEISTASLQLDQLNKTSKAKTDYMNMKSKLQAVYADIDHVEQEIINYENQVNLSLAKTHANDSQTETAH